MSTLNALVNPASNTGGEHQESMPGLETTVQGLNLAPKTLSIQATTWPRRILIVDDEAPARQICRMLLEPEAFQCDEAVSGRVALETLGEKPYDLVLLDIEMPGLGGDEVLRAMRERAPVRTSR